MISSEIIQQKLFHIAEIIHLRIFGHEMSDEMGKFLHHLSWSFFGVFVASGITAIANILAGRWLGPEEYGRYALIVSIATIFIIPMTLGIDTANTYYIAKSKSDEEKNKYIATTLWVASILIISVGTIIFFFANFLSRFFLVDASFLRIVLILSIFLAIRNIIDSIVKGLHIFRFQAFIRAGESVVVVLVFLSLIFGYGLFSFKSYVFAIVSGYIFASSCIFWKIRGRLALRNECAEEIISYGKYAIVGSISTVIFYSVDKILVNKYLGAEQLGIYNAYQTFSFLLVAQLIMFFINVFFPYMASKGDTGSILKKLNQLGLILFLPIFVLLTFVIWLALILLGNRYGLDWWLVFEFSFLATLSAYFYGLWWLINSKSEKGVRFTSLHGMIAGSIFVVSVFLFRRHLTLHQVVAFMIGAFSYMVFIGNVSYKKFIK